MPGVLKPSLVIEILLVMLLAGVGTAFAVEPGSNGSGGTPGPIPTAVPGNDYLTPSGYSIIYDDALMNVTGVTVTVHNKDNVAHSGVLT